MSIYSFSDIHIGNNHMTDDPFLKLHVDDVQTLNYKPILEDLKNEIILNGDIFEVEANDKAHVLMSDGLRKEIIDDDYKLPFGNYLHKEIITRHDTHYLMGNHDDVNGEYQTEQLTLNKGGFKIIVEHGDMADNNKFMLDKAKLFGTSIRRMLSGCFGFFCQGSDEGKFQHKLDTSQFEFEYLYKTRIDDGKGTLLCLLYALSTWLKSPYDLMLMGHTHDLLIVKITHKPSGKKFIYANSGSGSWYSHGYNNDVLLPGYLMSTKNLKPSPACSQGLRIDYTQNNLKVTALQSEYKIQQNDLKTLVVQRYELGSLSLP
jgi:predicted phosphodiesterase